MQAAGYLAGRAPGPQTSAAASVYGYAIASGWGAAVVLAGAVLTGLLINAPSPKRRPWSSAAARGR